MEAVLTRRQQLAAALALAVLAAFVFLLLPGLLEGAGGPPGHAPDEERPHLGTWVADTDATIEAILQDQLGRLPAEVRAAAEQEVERIKAGIPAETRAAVDRTRFELREDGTWNGSSPGGIAEGTWRQDGGQVVLSTKADGDALTGRLEGGKLRISGPGIPFTLVLRHQ